MYRMRVRVGMIVVLLAIAFAIQAAGYAPSIRSNPSSDSLGTYMLYVAFVLVIAASWFLGSGFGRKYSLVAAISGGVFGYLFAWGNLSFLFWLRVEVYQNTSESVFRSFSGVYSLFGWASVLICVFVAGIAAFSNVRKLD